MSGAIDSMLHGKTEIDDEFYDELEEILVMGDVGCMTASEIVEKLRERVMKKHLRKPEAVKNEIKEIVAEMLEGGEEMSLITLPSVILVIGVNGVGKTTTTASMGSILASKGYKVLLVDLDAQANLTSSLLKKEVTTTIYDGLKSQSSTSLYIYKVREDIRLDMIPADLNLAQADLELAGKMARERILSELLENYKSEYDYILIDCPPSLGLLTLNALMASDYVIIPLVAEVLPFNGLKMIFDFINQIKKFLNPKVNIFGIAITRWEGTKLSKNIEEDLRKQLDDLVFTTKIRKNVTIAQAPLEATNIVDYDKKSNGAQDYIALTEEFLERMVLNNVTISK